LYETRLLLLRHAETSAPDLFHGAESDVGLGKRGFRQAEAVAARLARENPDALYSSGMRRALQTAGAISRACGLEVQVDTGLHERKMGPLSGVERAGGIAAYDEAKRRWKAGETSYTHVGGESYDQIQARVVPIVERIVAESEGKTVVVVAHGVVIRVVLTTWLDGVTADFDRFAIDNVAINDLRWDGRGWSAKALNERIDTEYETFAW
jgi:2,3-bisphosphoglycerate-dependent phosphoglycerate mutase